MYTRRLANTASGPLIDTITILLGLTVGASTQASEFLTLDSIKIFGLGALSFVIATASGVIFQEAIADYDYETALILIAKEKTTIPLLLQKGKAQRGLGLNAEALSTYQEIIANDTANTRAYIEAAECCRSLAKNQQALKYYEQALDLNPENKYVRIQYINYYYLCSKFQEALG